MPFKIGEKVVCIVAHNSLFGEEIIKGNIYTIRGFTTCPNCGNVAVDIGKNLPIGINVHCSCSSTFISDGTWWLNPARFSKLGGDLVSTDEFMEIFIKQEEKINN